MAISKLNGDPNFRRQGDIGFFRLPKRAEKAKEAPEGPVLAHGEVTGHMHQVKRDCLGDCDVFLDANGLLVVQVKPGKTIDVVHDEHDPINLDGIGDDGSSWEIRRQREYESKGWKQVSD